MRGLKGRVACVILALLTILGFLTPTTIATNVVCNNNTTTNDSVISAKDHLINVNDVVKIIKSLEEYRRGDQQVLIQIHNEEEKTQRKIIDAWQDITEKALESKQNNEKNAIQKPTDSDDSKPDWKNIIVKAQNSNPMSLFLILVVSLVVIVAIVAIAKR